MGKMNTRRKNVYYENSPAEERGSGRLDLNVLLKRKKDSLIKEKKSNIILFSYGVAFAVIVIVFVSLY